MKNLPPFKFNNEPEEITNEERKEYAALLDDFKNKSFETDSARQAFMDFAPEYARFKELHAKFSKVVAFQGFVSHLMLSN